MAAETAGLLDQLLAGQPPADLLRHLPPLQFSSPEFQREVAAAEAVASRGPAAFTFGPDGRAELVVGTQHYAAGRFETPSLGELRARLEARHENPAMTGQQPAATHRPLLRLTILLGVSPLTDIQRLEADADGKTVFQLASQFNGLEAPKPGLVPVTDYFGDRTQGPLGALPAFPGALLRHYAAPGPIGRFVQTPLQQLNLLADVLPASARVEGGYLLAANIHDPAELARRLQTDFEAIRIGWHTDIQALGSARLHQVLTSTLAAGSYSPGIESTGEWHIIERQLLRAAYAGTLRAAVAAGKSRVVLTAIGGGVFANPHELIWQCLLWALANIQPQLQTPLEVVLNLRSFDLSADRLRADSRPFAGRVIQLP